MVVVFMKFRLPTSMMTLFFRGTSTSLSAGVHCQRVLARISHQLSPAAADPGMSTVLRSVGLLDRRLTRISHKTSTAET
jgi:hypothetical protein